MNRLEQLLEFYKNYTIPKDLLDEVRLMNRELAYCKLALQSIQQTLQIYQTNATQSVLTPFTQYPVMPQNIQSSPSQMIVQFMPQSVTQNTPQISCVNTNEKVPTEELNVTTNKQKQPKPQIPKIDKIEFTIDWIKNNPPHGSPQTVNYYQKYYDIMDENKNEYLSIQKFNQLVKVSGFRKKRINNIHHWI